MNPYVIIVRVVLPVICGGIIGMEREEKSRPAGFRTHMLVCLGSSIIMILSEYMFLTYYERYNITSDPLRMGAQVISGIGFLGAGTIIHHGTNIKGLTTAASLWTVAAIGLSFGSGFYFLGIIATIVVFIILFAFNMAEKKYSTRKHIFNTFEVNIIMENDPETLGRVNLVFCKFDVKILEMKFQSDEFEGGDLKIKPIVLYTVFRLKPGINVSEITQAINDLEGITRVERF
ncbi:MAG TPA: MgtC/SapB family protein [Mobilitalea sp.]|nr:MgtC/SapB family protein [Mobilitalea sp.]